MNKGILIFVLVFIAISALNIHAQELEYNIYDFKIRYGSVLVVNDMIFKGKANISSAVSLPKDAKGILLSINNEDVEPEVIEHESIKLLMINKKDVERVRISYITEEVIDANGFLANIRAIYPTKLLQVSLTLQPGTILEKGVLYPKPDKADSDEQTEILIWERGNFKDELSVYVKFRQRASLLWLAIPIAMFLIILILFMYYLKQQEPRGSKK